MRVHRELRKVLDPNTILNPGKMFEVSQKAKFIEKALSGQTDYTMTNEELEARDVYDNR